MLEQRLCEPSSKVDIGLAAHDYSYPWMRASSYQNQCSTAFEPGMIREEHIAGSNLSTASLIKY